MTSIGCAVIVKKELLFALQAEDGEADAGDDEQDGEGHGDFHDLFVLDGGLNGADLRDIFFLVVRESGMREADGAGKKEKDAENEDESLHGLKPYHRWRGKRESHALDRDEAKKG